MFYYKKILFCILIIASFLCVGAGEYELEEYAFFADTYEEAESIASGRGGELISFCQGIGVLRRKDGEKLQMNAELQGVKLYPDEVFTVDLMEGEQNQREQWHLNVLEAETVWKTSTGKGVTVAVIDSGIDNRHEDLKTGIVYSDTTIPESEYGTGKRFDAAYQGPEDYFGHGTHVAGIIGARNNGIGCTGIAPDCNLISVKALEKQGTTGKGKTSWVASAIRLAIEQGADIINLSLGGSSVKNEMLYTVIKEAWQKNIPVICAAGNISGKQMIFYPGAYDETIAVSALKQMGDSVTFASSYSNYGDWIDISAPGSSIISTIPGGYGTKTGTSMACPVVAGGVALLLEKKSDLSVEEISSFIYSSATDLGDAGKDDQYGYGAINLKQMLFSFENEYMIPQPVIPYEDGSKIRKGTMISINTPERAQKVVYTTDGTEPGADSPVYPSEGIVFGEEQDKITINSRCVMEDGTLGKNVSVTYVFVDCDRFLKKKQGEQKEEFPDYGNYIDEKTGYPYKRYELKVNAGEELEFKIKNNEFSSVLYLYDSLEMKHQIAEGKEKENKNSVLTWKNESNKSKKVYAVIMVADSGKDLGELSYEIAWKVMGKNNSESSGQEVSSQEEDVTEKKAETGESTSEHQNREEKEISEKKQNMENELANQSKIAEEDSSKEEEPVYEEDWLYAMEPEEISVSGNDTISDNMTGENTIGESQKDSVENREEDLWKKLKSDILIIVCFGVFVEIFVIIWYRKRKKKDDRTKSKE